MKIQDLKEWQVLLGMDRYIVLGISSKFTVEVFNLDTWEEETIEGDYLDNGDISHLELEAKGDIETYINNFKNIEYKDKVSAKVAELKEFYS